MQAAQATLARQVKSAASSARQSSSKCNQSAQWVLLDREEERESGRERECRPVT